ncbi:MAG: NFACT family protein [Lachnospiraceae bacterium]|nr:NFACT family protein [Lachnospiraceae bacterium]
MALDGIVIANIVQELQTTLAGGRITKIAQPEKDELLLTVKQSRQDGDGNTLRSKHLLTISVNPGLPLIYLTEENKTSPLQAPTFCMVLRKHLNNCKILSVEQIELERVIRFRLEHLNEMGDLCTKLLYVELMGKHSNIIFCEEDDTIIDSIKRVSLLVSSVREVLPGRAYFIPNTQEKFNPLTVSEEEFLTRILCKPLPPAKAMYTSLTGLSPVVAGEILYRSSLSDRESTDALSEMEKLHLYRNFTNVTEQISAGQFSPTIITKEGMPVEFSSIPLTVYEQDERYVCRTCRDASTMLREYYETKEILTRIRQKSSDLRRITTTALERTRKKYDLQSRQLKDTEKREKYKIYGELLTTYGYELHGGEKSITCDNYYTNEPVTIPLDETKTALENAKRYFERYAKQKRTFEALTIQLGETKQDMEHLESISNALDIARQENDLEAIRQELAEYGYIRKHSGGKKNAKHTEKSKPLHFLSTDGFHMYVGKNNYQNDALTFHVATGNDWWFHAKASAGSHVIVKTEGQELPDRTFEEAARLAAYFSKAREQGKAEVDYIQKKHIKKPNGSKPGFVVYYTNYSMTISTDITGIQEIPED